jgi:hypothetical protein
VLGKEPMNLSSYHPITGSWKVGSVVQPKGLPMERLWHVKGRKEKAL